MVNTAADAKSIVSMSKFPPVGIRGQGSAFACFEHGLATPAEYVREANQNTLVMLQIESLEGLKNVDEICQVEGVGNYRSLVSWKCAVMADRRRYGVHWPE